VRRRGSGFVRWLRYQYVRLMRINDSPEKVASGLALGVAIGVLPSFGLGVIAALFIAGYLGLNRAAAVIGSLVMNPWTAPFFWGLSFLAGSLMLGNDLGETFRVIKELKVHGDPWSSLLARELLLPYLVGNIIVTLSVCAMFYAGSLYAMRAYRRAKKKRLERRLEKMLRHREGM